MKENQQLVELMQKLKLYTLNYCEELGINVVNGKVSCLNPDHPDKNPSMSYWHAHNIFYCFSCSFSCDIFKIAALREGKPEYGKEFILQNVFYLAQKFNEPYQHINIDVSPEEKARFRKFEIMRLLRDYVTAKLNKAFLVERKISVETALKLNIGSVDSYDNLLKKYIENGFTEEEIKALGITRKRVNEHKMIFIIKNIYGQPVSFVSREMFFTIENVCKALKITKEEYKQFKNKEERETFLHQKCNGDNTKISFVQNFLTIGKYENGNDSEIYSKRSIFYGYSDVKKEINSFEKVLIVEGYIDFVTSYQKGFRNIVALGSASFTKEHLQIIEDSKEIRFPAITFDQDTTGIKRTKDLVERIKEHGNIRKKFFIAKYKNESCKDIDEILNTQIIKHFEDIFEYETLFQYSISNMQLSGMSEEQIVEQMIPLIIQEPSPLKQSELAGELEKKLNTISKHTITAEIEYRLNNVRQQLSETVMKILDSARNKIINNPESAIGHLQQSIEEIETINITKKQKNIFALTEENFSIDEEKKRDALRHNINWGIPILKTMDITPGKTITVAAKPNIGKTSFFVNLMKEILLLNKNTVVYYYTTDDSRGDIKDNLIAVLTGLPRQYIKDPIHNPYYGINSTNVHKNDMLAKYNYGNNLIENWVKQKRLAILHTSDGASEWSEFERTLKYDLSGDKDLENSIKVLIIDSVNKIDVDGITNGNERAEFLSERTKKAASKYDLVVFQNYEIRKVDKAQKINLSLLAGTRRIEYDSDAIITLHQPLHELAGLSKTKWNNNTNYDLPIIVAEIEKTKIGGIKNLPYFHKLQPVTNTLIMENDIGTINVLNNLWREDIKNYRSS